MKVSNLFTRLSRFFLTLYLVNLGVVVMLFYKGGLSPVFLLTNFIAIAGLVVSRGFALRLYLPITALFFSSIYILAFLMHFKADRITSLAYALYYLISFMVAVGNVSELLTRQQLGKIIRLVVYLHLVVMVVQQLGYLLHLPILNLNPGFGDDYFENLSLFRLNALSNEPSYGATIMVILGYIYYYLFPDFKNEWLRFWLPTLYLFVFFQSALATILAPLMVLVMLLGKRWWLLPFAVFILYLVVFNLETDNRVVTLIQNLDWQNLTDTFIQTDLSGAFRVVPSIFYLQQADPFSLEFWMGHGIDYGNEYVSRRMPGVEVFDVFAGGAVPFILYDYGILCFAAFVFFIESVASIGNKIAFWLLAVFILVNANFSTQLLWFFIAFCVSAKMLKPASPAIAVHQQPEQATETVLL